MSIQQVFALAALCQQDDFRTFHIVRYQQAWLEDDGTLYIQTELCTATLRDEMTGAARIDDGSATQSLQRIDVFRQLKVLREVLLALELVHQQGMVHLDIKPENIFVKNNLYKLGDFGLANASTKIGGQDATIPDIEEGDSRYMSKDLLESGPKDLTKVIQMQLNLFFSMRCSQTLFIFISALCFKSASVISFHWVRRCTKFVQGIAYPAVVRTGRTYGMESFPRSPGQCHALMR